MSGFNQINSEIETYITELKNKQGNPASTSEQRKTRKALSVMIDILASNGRSWPIEIDYEEYSSKSSCNERGTKDNVARVKKFFDWLLSRRENLQGVDDKHDTQPDFSPSQASDNTQEISNDHEPIREKLQGVDYEHETLPDFVPSHEGDEKQTHKRGGKRDNAGRKTKNENGEKLEKFATVYLTPTQADKFKALCSLDGLKISDKLREMIEKEIEANSDLIESFFALEKRRKERINTP